MKKSFEIGASLVCGDPLNLKKEVTALDKAKVDYIHFDVMDGMFVPRYGLYPEILVKLKQLTKIPVDIHMMAVNPEPHIDTFSKAGANIFYVHVEGNYNLHRTLLQIKHANMKPGVVLNIATPINILDFILNDIDYIMLMGINPGILGHKIIPTIFDKIKSVKNKLGDRKIKIQVDGGVNFKSSARMIYCGADILVCGTSTIFRPQDGGLLRNIKHYRNLIINELNGVNV